MGRRNPDLPSLQRAITRPPLSMVAKVLSGLYRLIVSYRVKAYESGRFKSKKIPGFVVSIGNVTVGGTGKTPATIMLAQWAKEQGLKVAVISRGYGGRFTGDVLEVSNGSTVSSSPMECGDEPFMIARRLQGVPVVISKERFKAGMYAYEKFGTEFFILDDGFQHLALKRDLDIVLIDSQNPFGNGYLLPYGILREPVESLARGDAFILTRSNEEPRNCEAAKTLRKRFSDIPIFTSTHVPDALILPNAEVRVKDVTTLKDKRIIAFSGIANHSFFVQSLKELGAQVVHHSDFGDHHLYSRGEIERIIRLGDSFNVDYLVTTEKDWVKIHTIGVASQNLGYLSIKFKVVEEEDFFSFIIRDYGI